MKKQAQLEARQVQDKLISAFQSKPQADWRKLMTFSEKWPMLADGVLKRCGCPSLSSPPTPVRSPGRHACLFQPYLRYFICP